MTIVEHVVHVHFSIGAHIQNFLFRLRGKNYVTPKHYLDFLQMYLKLLDEKNSYIKAQVWEEEYNKSQSYECGLHVLTIKAIT
jgi:hypothetical protein